MKDSLIVLSGGMDSTTLLHEYASRIALAVTFHYGANHNAPEAECARYNCSLLGIPHLEIPLDFMGRRRARRKPRPFNRDARQPRR